MSSFEVTIKRVEEVEHHPNADRLDLVRIDDYRCIVGRDQFTKDQLVAYIPEAAVLPEWLIKDLGLEGRLAGKQKNRVKAVKLRQVLSQGLVYPVIEDAVGNRQIKTGPDDWCFCNVVEGQDVTNMLGITKYEPPIPVSMAGEVHGAGGYTIKYDIENLKKYPDVFEEGEPIVLTEKLHGCVSPDTLIMLPNGEEIPIGDVINDDTVTHVMSYDIETQRFKPKQITAKFRRPNTENKRWMKLTLETGRVLKITEDHPVFSNERNKYIPANNVRPGEDIKSPI